MKADDAPKRSLADDPVFRASLADLDRRLSDEDQRAEGATDDSLSDLDRGLIDETSQSSSPARPRATAGPRRTARTVPGSSALPLPEVFPLALLSEAPPGSQDRRRPLMDLFPPLALPSAPPPVPVRLSLAPPARAGSQDAESSATYETFYGLHERPFSLSTDPRFFYRSTTHNNAAQALLDAVGRHDGLVVMTGAAGLGKTTLCRAVLDQLDRRTLTSLVADKFISTDNLLKTLLADFGVISQDDVAGGMLASASRAGLAAALHDFLVSLAALQAFAVVIIDDAHDLPIEVLGEIRAFAEDIGDEPALQIVLVGEPSLEDTLGGAALRDWNQRVSTRCRLTPIAADEVGNYIVHRLAVAGTGSRVEFGQTAIERVQEVSGGVPRVINLLCDRTLEEGFKISASMLDGELVKAAAEGLDLSSPSLRSSWAQKAATLAVMLVLVLVGAAGAAVVFRSELSVLLDQWQNAPSVPSPPQPGATEPIDPVPPPG